MTAPASPAAAPGEGREVPIQTAGDLRGFLAGVLSDLRAKRLSPDQGAAIAKVAGEINKSLAVEVQAAIHAGIKKPVPGSMVVASSEDMQTCASPQADQHPEPPKDITEIITAPVADPVDPARAPPAKPMRLEDATANFRRKQDGDKVWCEQCEMRVTVEQAVGCRSAFCKAKEAA